MTTNEVARLFGVNPVTPRRWVLAGYLAGIRQNRNYEITPVNIQTFIQRRDTWMLWDPARITNPALRQRACWLRYTTPGRWYSTADLAARYHYSQRAVQRWLIDGRLPVMRRFQECYVWSSDLAGFTPPVDAWTVEDYSQFRRKAAVARLANWAKDAAV